MLISFLCRISTLTNCVWRCNARLNAAIAKQHAMDQMAFEKTCLFRCAELVDISNVFVLDRIAAFFPFLYECDTLAQWCKKKEREICNLSEARFAVCPFPLSLFIPVAHRSPPPQIHVHPPSTHSFFVPASTCTHAYFCLPFRGVRFIDLGLQPSLPRPQTPCTPLHAHRNERTNGQKPDRPRCCSCYRPSATRAHGHLSPVLPTLLLQLPNICSMRRADLPL